MDVLESRLGCGAASRWNGGTVDTERRWTHEPGCGERAPWAEWGEGRVGGEVEEREGRQGLTVLQDAVGSLRVKGRCESGGRQESLRRNVWQSNCRGEREGERTRETYF